MSNKIRWGDSFSRLWLTIALGLDCYFFWKAASEAIPILKGPLGQTNHETRSICDGDSDQCTTAGQSEAGRDLCPKAMGRSTALELILTSLLSQNCCPSVLTHSTLPVSVPGSSNAALPNIPLLHPGILDGL